MQIGVETSRAVENKRVFVVHGDEIIRAALQFMLHDENEAHEVNSLADAYARGADRKVDLVLLDLAIVRQEGMAVLRTTKERLPGARILLVAERLDDAFAQQCLTAGADGVLATPLKLETVRRKVDALLGRVSVTPLRVL